MTTATDDTLSTDEPTKVTDHLKVKGNEGKMIKETLKTIPDERPILDYNPTDKPLANLIEGYRTISERVSYLPTVDDKMTGAEFKQALTMMNHQVLIGLLYQYNRDYLTHTGIVNDPSDDGIVSKSTREFLIKSVILMVVFTVCVIMVMVGTIGTLRGDIDSNFVLSGFIGIANDVLNNIVGSPQ